MGWLNSSIAKAILFQVAWFGCILSAADGQLWLASLVIWATAIFLARGLPMALIVLSVAFNVFGDGALCRLGLLLSAEGAVQTWPPFWLMGLWVAFAALVPSGFSWLKGRLWLAAILGAVFGPISYASGVKLGALQFGSWTDSILGVGVLWLVAFPTLVWFGTKERPSLRDPTSGASQG